jgi:hypothetical protein
MRTTLDIDDDVLDTAKKMAVVRKSSAGRVISDLVRKALEAPELSLNQLEFSNGFPQFPRTGQTIAAEMIRDLIEEEDRETIARGFGAG